MNLRNQKGITMVAEVLTIVIFTLLIGTITYSSMSSFQVRDLNNMYADISAIQEKAANYYLKYGEAPIKGSNIPVDELYSTIVPQRNPNDGDGDYYRVDFSKLLNVSLNNKPIEIGDEKPGEDPIAPEDEVYYIINTKTLTVYYSKGVEVDKLINREENSIGNEPYTGGEAIYYTIPSNYMDVTKIPVENYQ